MHENFVLLMKGLLMYFEPIKFIENLKYMGIGMLGVFIIVGIIMASVYVIGSVNSKNSK